MYNLVAGMLSVFSLSGPVQNSYYESIKIPTRHEMIKSVAFCNNMIAVAGDKGCALYSPQGKLERDLSQDDIYNMAVTRDASKLALSGKQAIEIHYLQSEQKKHVAPIRACPCNKITFIPKGLCIYNTSGKGFRSEEHTSELQS